LNSKLAARSIAIIAKFKDIYPQRDVSDLAQFFIDRYNDSIKDPSKLVETEVVLQALETSKSLSKKIS
jgi:hypothetical protein